MGHAGRLGTSDKRRSPHGHADGSARHQHAWKGQWTAVSARTDTPSAGGSVKLSIVSVLVLQRRKNAWTCAHIGHCSFHNTFRTDGLLTSTRTSARTTWHPTPAAPPQGRFNPLCTSKAVCGSPLGGSAVHLQTSARTTCHLTPVALPHTSGATTDCRTHVHGQAGPLSGQLSPPPSHLPRLPPFLTRPRPRPRLAAARAGAGGGAAGAPRTPRRGSLSLAS